LFYLPISLSRAAQALAPRAPSPHFGVLYGEMILSGLVMIQNLIQQPLNELQAEAFRIRKENFGNELTFSIPGVVSYRTGEVPFQRNRFAAISVTGKRCDLQCGHCKAKLLESMIPAVTPDLLLQVAHRLRSDGALGILISGGADRNGEVPLKTFIPAIRSLKQEYPGFKVIAHTGLLQRETAIELKEAGLDQILIDVIGDDDTIREVYHLEKRVKDYEQTLLMLKEIGHRLAPHIIIGHHFGVIRGEWRALEMVSRVGVDTLVLVVFKPMASAGAGIIPRPDEVSRIAAIARIVNPSTSIRMGCIRPAHSWKAEMEKGGIDSGVNTIAYPLQGTIDYAQEIGLETRFVEMCCSLL